QVDVTRVASQIVVGVGFLGGGAILKEGATVRGLTTAASLWVTAAVSLACAVGLYVLASVTTAGVLVSLVGLRGATSWIDRRVARQAIESRLQVGDLFVGKAGQGRTTQLVGVGFGLFPRLSSGVGEPPASGTVFDKFLALQPP